MTQEQLQPDVSGTTEPVRLVTFAQAAEGKHWYWPHVQIENRWGGYYQGYLNPLFEGAKTLSRGLIYDSEVRVRFNAFKLTSDAFRRGTITELPTITGTHEAEQNRIDALLPNFYRELDKAVQWWSIKGRFVMKVRERADGSYMFESPDPTTCFPLTDEARPDLFKGFLFATPYASDMDLTRQRARIDTIKLEYFIEGKDSVTEYRNYVPYIIGSLKETADPLIKYVSYIPLYDHYYHNIEEFVRELSISFSAISKLRNQTGRVIISHPDEVTNAMKTLLNSTGGAVAKPEDNEYQILTIPKEPMDSLIEAAHEQLSQILTISNLPPSFIGITPTQAETGAAREQLAYLASSKIDALRRELRHQIPLMFEAAGAGRAENITARWSLEPFSPVDTHLRQAVELYRDGIYTLNEVRKSRGLPPVEGGDMTREQIGRENQSPDNPTEQPVAGNGN